MRGIDSTAADNESAVDDTTIHDDNTNGTTVDDEVVGNDEVFVDKAMDDTYVAVDDGAVYNVYMAIEDVVVNDVAVI